jgi:hypothetical protein
VLALLCASALTVAPCSIAGLCACFSFASSLCCHFLHVGVALQCSTLYSALHFSLYIFNVCLVLHHVYGFANEQRGRGPRQGGTKGTYRCGGTSVLVPNHCRQCSSVDWALGAVGCHEAHAPSLRFVLLVVCHFFPRSRVFRTCQLLCDSEAGYNVCVECLRSPSRVTAKRAIVSGHMQGTCNF